ncbi:hypothetical protein ACF0H5_010668 [Mactra antiquata]
METLAITGTTSIVAAFVLAGVVLVSASSSKDLVRGNIEKILYKAFKLRNAPWVPTHYHNENDTVTDSATKLTIPETFNNSSDNGPDSPKLIQKKSEQTANPWICSTIDSWRDLGDAYYPRFVKEVSCSQTTCMYDSYSCKQRHYPLQVLSERVNGGADSLLPRQLRHDWQFSEIQISVGCYCGN